MVGAKIGPVIGILGSILMICFGFIFFLEHNLAFVDIGHDLIFIRLGFALGLGAVGIIGGILALKVISFGNFFPLLGAIIAIIGLFIPIGEVGYYIPPFTSYYSKTLYSTFYIEIFLMCLGTVLSLLNIYTERKMVKKTQELAIKTEILKKAKKLLFDYLEENKGKAFSAKSLYKRCIEDTPLDVSLTEIEKLMYDLHLLGKVRLDIKENVNYYFFS